MNSKMSRPDASLSLRIKEEAQRLGFELVGISPVKPPRHENSFAEWLRKGLAGELAYMRRTEELRRDPQKLVPWAVSLVSVGMNYFTPFPRSVMPGEPKGWISRYAWGDDYHDLMRRRLESLLTIIRYLCHGPVEGKAFVDSGPVFYRYYDGVVFVCGIVTYSNLVSINT